MTVSAESPLVYVVDDDEALRDSLRWLLESAGYRAATYSTAERFLAAYRPGVASCLVLDVRMPGLTGLELQQELNRRGQPLPIIFITGHGDVPMAVNAVKNGAFHFLEKPFKDAQLLEVIEQAASGRPRTCRASAAALRCSTAGDAHPARARSSGARGKRPQEQTDSRRSRHQRQDRRSAPGPCDGKNGREQRRRARPGQPQRQNCALIRAVSCFKFLPDTRVGH